MSKHNENLTGDILFIFVFNLFDISGNKKGNKR